MIPILRLPGFQLNPNDKVVNAILKRCESNGGHCPCRHYREDNVCCCNLYIKQ